MKNDFYHNASTDIDKKSFSAVKYKSSSALSIA